MTVRAKFCAYCGTEFRENDRFCGQCGQPVPTLAPAPGPQAAPAQPDTAPPVPQPAAPPAPAPEQPVAPAPEPRRASRPEEAILGVVASVQRRHGFMGLKVDSYSVIVTPQRLVFAYLSKQTMNDAVRQANAEAKAQGKGFFGVIGAQLRWLEVLTRKYYEMQPSEIFQVYPGSFQIANNEIRRIRFFQSGDDDSSRVEEKIRFETVSGKHEFTLVGTNRKQATQVLSQTLKLAIH
jgi:hypothetical protein